MADNGKQIYGSGWRFPTGVAASMSAIALNEATDAIEIIFKTPPNEAPFPITRLGRRQTTFLLSPEYELSLQGVVDGVPDGVIKSSGNARYVFTPTAPQDGLFEWGNMIASYTPATPGELLAWVLKPSGVGTIDATHNCSFVSHHTHGQSIGKPYAQQNNAGSRTKQTGVPVFGYGSATKKYGNPVQNLSSLTFGADTLVADEWATTFLIPAGVAYSYKVGATYWHLASASAGRLIRYRLYNDTTVLHEVTDDSDDQFVGANKIGESSFDDTFPLSTLLTGIPYHLSVQQTASTLALIALDVGAADDMDAFPGGQNVYASSRLDNGAWVAVPTRRISMFPIIYDMEKPASAVAAPIFDGLIVR